MDQEWICRIAKEPCGTPKVVCQFPIECALHGDLDANQADQATAEMFEISNPFADGATPPWPAMGPSPWTTTYTPWMTSVAGFRCPSDPGTGLPAMGRTNYVACIGDGTHRCDTGAINFDTGNSRWFSQENVALANRGTFFPRKRMGFRDVLDGLANTIMGGEITTDLGDRDVRTSARQNAGLGSIHSATPPLPLV